MKIQKANEDMYRSIYENGKSRCNSIYSELPTQIALELTRRCNLNCEYCPRQTNPYIKHSYDLTLKLAESLNDVWRGCESVVFCGGGEPFLHPGWYQVAKIIRKQSDTCSIAITTNGTIPLKGHVTKLNELKVSLVFSLDTLEKYSLRTGSNTVNVIDNIEQVVKIKKENGYEYPKLVLVSMLTTDTIDNIPDVLRFGIDQGIDSFHVEKINPIWNDMCEKQRVDLYQPEIIQELFDDLFKIAEDSPTKIEGKLSYIYGPHCEIIDELIQGQCMDPWLFAVISCVGVVDPCPNYVYPFRHGVLKGGRTVEQIKEIIVGGTDIYDEQLIYGDTLGELWNSPALQRLRQHHIDGTPYYNCQNCRGLCEHNSWFKCT